LSIIYEALKKVEASQSAGSLALRKVKAYAFPKPRKSNRKIYLFFLLLVSLAALAGNIFLTSLSRVKEVSSSLPQAPVLAQNPKPAETLLPSPAVVLPVEAPQAVSAASAAEAKKEPEPSFVLNGVFFSEDEGYALINNQIAKVGDVIEGAQVTRISIDEVELENAGKTITLATAK
jgi:type II secretory pathway component PulC